MSPQGHDTLRSQHASLLQTAGFRPQGILLLPVPITRVTASQQNRLPTSLGRCSYDNDVVIGERTGLIVGPLLVHSLEGVGGKNRHTECLGTWAEGGPSLPMQLCVCPVNPPQAKVMRLQGASPHSITSKLPSTCPPGATRPYCQHRKSLEWREQTTTCAHTWQAPDRACSPCVQWPQDTYRQGQQTTVSRQLCAM